MHQVQCHPNVNGESESVSSPPFLNITFHKEAFVYLSYTRHKDFFCPAPSSVLRNAQGTPPPEFCNGLDWRALIKLRPPNIGKLREYRFFFFFGEKFF